MSVEAETEDTVRSVGTEWDELEDTVELRAGVRLLELDILVTMEDELSLRGLIYVTRHHIIVTFSAPDLTIFVSVSVSVCGS